MSTLKKPSVSESVFRQRDQVEETKRSFIHVTDLTLLTFTLSTERACFPSPGEKRGTLKLPENVSKHLKRWMYNNNFHFKNGITVTGGDTLFDNYKAEWQLTDPIKYQVARECLEYAFDSIAKTTTKEVKKLGGIISMNSDDSGSKMHDPRWDAAFSYCNDASWDGRWIAPASWTFHRVCNVVTQSMSVLSPSELYKVRDMIARHLVSAVVPLQKISG